MSELVLKLEEILALPDEVHWFCDYHNLFDTKDESSQADLQQEIATNLRLRQDQAAQCLTLYSYDDAVKYQEAFAKGVDKQLARCDVCIVEYYKARQRLVENLRHEYDEELVAVLEKTFSDRDIERIKKSLDSVERKLSAVEPAQRKKNILTLEDQLGMFEALCNRSFLQDDFLLSKYFQSPFSLVQTNKRLSITHYVPASTIFLFGKHFERRAWAIHVWSKYRQNITTEDFDFAIRDFLFSYMQDVFPAVNDPANLERFWFGVGTLVNKLDNNLITHSLRSMDIDIFMLALDNLKYDAPGLHFLLQAIQSLLELAPKDFWDAMGAISPTTFVEQVFNNAQYDKIMESDHATIQPDQNLPSPIKLLAWIQPFMDSLENVHQARACRSFAFQLLNRLQADRFSELSKRECYKCGLDVLFWTLRNCLGEGKLLTNSSRIAAAEVLEVVNEHSAGIIGAFSPTTFKSEEDHVEQLRLTVIEMSLTLDCKCLKTDQEILKHGNELPEASHSHASAIWDAVLLSLDRGNLSLAEAALSAINELLGLEKFKVSGGEPAYKEKSGFNLRLGRLNHLACQVLERVNDFRPTDLDRLYSTPKTAVALISSLMSPDASLYEAGVNLIKSVSSELARKEAVGHLLKTFLETTVYALSNSLRRITQSRSFGPCARMLKSSSDVLDVLCNSQEGLLRAQNLSTMVGLKAIKGFWACQWEILGMIYETTEHWSQARVADSNLLKEFCRDVMQFSQRLFNQYDVFANVWALTTTSTGSQGVGGNYDKSTSKDLMKYPTTIMHRMIKWLRLRDPYLLEISVKLTKQMLNRLTETRLKVPEEPAAFLEQVVTGDKSAKTNLMPQERAEIARALEANLGHPVLLAPELDPDIFGEKSHDESIEKRPKKNQAIDLDKWAAKAKATKQTFDLSDDEISDSGILDKELLSVSQSVEMMNRMKEHQKQLASKQISKRQETKPSLQAQKALKKPPTTAVKAAAERVSFKEKREEEREAKRRRDAQALALVKKKAGTLGEGSGIGGLGIKGKDHAPKGPSMMVSSGSESESGDTDEELFGKLNRPVKVSDAVREYERAKSTQTNVRQPLKKVRQVRSAKDMRARLAPDLTALHKTILGWDFFHNGDFPPGSDRNDYSLVTNKFRTPVEYSETFQPLLILEAWQSLLQSKDEGNFKKFEVKVASRMNVDAFIEMSTTMPLPEAKEVGLGEADIVLFSKGKSPAADETQPNCLGRACKINRKKGVMEVTYKINVGNNLLSAMVPNATLYAVKVNSITPLEREYGALLGLKYYDLCDEITKGKPSPLLQYSDQQLAPLVKAYDVNTAQAKAIKCAFENDAFTLIQGPPGSGKTKTIVAIVGALLSGVLAHKDNGVPIARPRNPAIDRSGKAVAAKKLLVCAPSNAAVDELVMRFKEGVKVLNGDHEKVSVVRLGRSEAINSKVLDVTLEELVSAKLNIAIGKTTNSGEDIQKLMMSHKATSENLNNARDKLDQLKAEGKTTPPELKHEFELLKRKKQQLSNQIDTARDSGDVAARDAEIRRRTVQQEVLDGAHVICATLSGSGHDMFQNLNIEFETVIIDEAAQSIELSALIPLKYGCSKCILVGDPKQLPPTVLSREAARFQYEQSLFVRMQANHPGDVHLLDTQYRMHPEISSFPSNAFYDSKLLDGPSMADIRAKPWHRNSVLGPYRFFDVQGMHQSAPRGHSLINLAEVDVALKLYGRLRQDNSSYDFKGKVGVITPYKSQLRELRARFASNYGDEILTHIDFNTTDSFQGRESEVIIFSCVRASSSGGIGFLSDIRRMNVGITRAKASLWVLGNARSLMQGEYWSRLVSDARIRDRYTSDMGLLDQESPPETAHPKPKTAIDRDVEMTDAPVEASGVPRGSVLPGHANVGNAGAGHDSSRLGPPSGGWNGLNDNLTCSICGSFAHQTYYCDNLEAKEIVFGRCHRCKQVGHPRNRCEAELCVTCGQTGHTSAKCVSSTVLPRKERERLMRKESELRASRQRDLETEKRRQLGEHDRQIPVVRSTLSSDSETEVRKRTDEPRRTKPVNDASISNSKVISAQQQTEISSTNERPKSAESYHDEGAPPKADPTTQPVGTTSHKDKESMKSTIIKQGDASHKPSTFRAPFVSQNNVRPLKRKKEADPFIRPKKK